jgi:hypothetical protein
LEAFFEFLAGIKTRLEALLGSSPMFD